MKVNIQMGETLERIDLKKKKSHGDRLLLYTAQAGLKLQIILPQLS